MSLCIFLIIYLEGLLTFGGDGSLANVTSSSLLRSPPPLQGRCILEGTEDVAVTRGFDRLDGLVSRHIDELPGVLQKASTKAYRETRRYRTLWSKYSSVCTWLGTWWSNWFGLTFIQQLRLPNSGSKELKLEKMVEHRNKSKPYESARPNVASCIYIDITGRG